MKTRLPSKKDEPSHETPRIEMIAVRPLRMIVPLRVASGDALNKIIVKPETAIMTIIIAIPMLT